MIREGHGGKRPDGEDAALTRPVGAADHTRGPGDAPVTLLMYGDYECPYTRRAQPVVRALERETRGGLRFAYRNFPLTEIHPHAQAAAEAAEAAGAQDRFWEMYELLFENQRALSDEDLRRHAARLGLDTERFGRGLEERAYASRVREDLEGGLESGAKGTPTFFVNGVRHDGPTDIDGLRNAVHRAAT